MLPTRTLVLTQLSASKDALKHQHVRKSVCCSQTLENGAPPGEARREELKQLVVRTATELEGRQASQETRG